MDSDGGEDLSWRRAMALLRKTQEAVLWGLLIANLKTAFCDLLMEETS